MLMLLVEMHMYTEASSAIGDSAVAQLCKECSLSNINSIAPITMWNIFIQLVATKNKSRKVMMFCDNNLVLMHDGGGSGRVMQTPLLNWHLNAAYTGNSHRIM